MPAITQYQAGDPTVVFFSGRFETGDQAVFQSPTSFYWAHPRTSGDSAVWGGGVVVNGVGLLYEGALLADAKKVTSLQVIASYGPAIYTNNPVVTFSGLSLSADDTTALLEGNATRLHNIIDANQWEYQGSGGNDSFTSGRRADTLDGGEGSDVLVGAGGNDIIRGGGGIDTIYGGLGDDKITGGPGGDDLMYGGEGNDRFYVDTNSDRVREYAREGRDSVYAADDFFLFPTASIELLSAADPKVVATINLTGNDFAQTIIGNAGGNNLQGRGGTDVLRGLGGTDNLVGGTANDRLIGGKGNDTFVLRDGDGKDRIMDFDAIGGANGRDLIDAAYPGDAAIHKSGKHDTLINFGGGDTLLLFGVRSNQIDESDFLQI